MLATVFVLPVSHPQPGYDVEVLSKPVVRKVTVLLNVAWVVRLNS